MTFGTQPGARDLTLLGGGLPERQHAHFDQFVSLESVIRYLRHMAELDRPIVDFAAAWLADDKTLSECASLLEVSPRTLYSRRLKLLKTICKLAGRRDG